MSPKQKDDIGALEKARKKLYEQDTVASPPQPYISQAEHKLHHEWDTAPIENIPHRGERHVRIAGTFLTVAFIFFILSLGAAGYLFYYGGNSVSADKITIDIQGPTTIAGGDTVPLSITISNRNSVSVENATIEINFPDGTRTADGALSTYPRFTEDLGTIASGETITRSIKAVIFGGAGQALLLPVTITYGTSGSNSVFEKKASYTLAVASAPLSVSVESLSETVSGQPLSFNIIVRSNATVPLNSIILSIKSPFGFTVTDSSLVMNGANFLLGTMLPGASKNIKLTGTLTGQDGEQKVFHFTVGTSKSEKDQLMSVAYMSQSATVVLASPFIATTLSINGETKSDIVISAGTSQSVNVLYVNTLATNVSNATIAIAISGSSVDYNSIQTTNGFYNSTDRTIIFSRDTDPSLAIIAPGASGIGSFTFSTMPAGVAKAIPSVTLTVSVSGVRVGQTNVPERVSASFVKTIKVATVVNLTAASFHQSGPFAVTGNVPPRVGQPTSYNIVWNVRNGGSSIANGVVSAVLPSYVSYNDRSSGSGSFSYDSGSRTVLWNIGDMAQGANVQGVFQIILIPSSSQVGTAPALTSPPSFSGYDRFAGIQVSAFAEPSTTDTKGDPGYMITSAFVQ